VHYGANLWMVWRTGYVETPASGLSCGIRLRCGSQDRPGPDSPNKLDAGDHLIDPWSRWLKGPAFSDFEDLCLSARRISGKPPNRATQKQIGPAHPTHARPTAVPGPWSLSPLVPVLNSPPSPCQSSCHRTIDARRTPIPGRRRPPECGPAARCPHGALPPARQPAIRTA
jgi:hypothetical protein